VGIRRESNLIALEVDHKGEEGWTGHHDVDHEDPGILSALAGLVDSVVGMQGDVAGRVWDFKEINSEQLEHRLRGGRLDAVLQIRQPPQLEGRGIW
jgi:hypothetical protein